MKQEGREEGSLVMRQRDREDAKRKAVVGKEYIVQGLEPWRHAREERLLANERATVVRYVHTNIHISRMSKPR